jgi:hypothetical protein
MTRETKHIYSPDKSRAAICAVGPSNDRAPAQVFAAPCSGRTAKLLLSRLVGMEPMAETKVPGPLK